MTRKANKRFLLIGIGVTILAILAAQLDQHTDFAFAHYLVWPLMFAAFVLLFVLGIVPWLNTIALKYPTQNTQGYKVGYVPEREKERGRYGSQGYRRKWERRGLRLTRLLKWYIESEEKN